MLFSIRSCWCLRVLGSTLNKPSSTLNFSCSSSTTPWFSDPVTHPLGHEKGLWFTPRKLFSFEFWPGRAKYLYFHQGDKIWNFPRVEKYDSACWFNYSFPCFICVDLGIVSKLLVNFPFHWFLIGPLEITFVILSFDKSTKEFSTSQTYTYNLVEVLFNGDKKPSKKKLSKGERKSKFGLTWLKFKRIFFLCALIKSKNWIINMTQQKNIPIYIYHWRRVLCKKQV